MNGGLLTIMSRTRGWLTMDKELNRTRAAEVAKEKNAGSLNRTSKLGPDWMQTTKNFYNKEHVGVGHKMFR